MTEHRIVDWMDPRSLFAPADEHLSAPIPVPAWIVRSFGTPMPRRRRSAVGPVTGLHVTEGPNGVTHAVRWAADSKWGSPDYEALDMLLWLARAATVGAIPTSQPFAPSVRQIASWRGDSFVSGYIAREIRQRLQILGAIRAWDLVPVDPSVSLTREDIERWDASAGGDAPGACIRTTGLLDVEYSTDTTVSPPKTSIKQIALHYDIRSHRDGVETVWIDPAWHGSLTPLATRWLHRLVDPAPPVGWNDAVVTAQYQDVVEGLGLSGLSLRRREDWHKRLNSAAATLQEAGWIQDYTVERYKTYDARVATYYWAPGDRLIAHRSTTALALHRLTYRDRVIPAALLRLGASPANINKWIATFSPQALREIVQYAMWRQSTPSKLKHPLAYITACLQAHTTTPIRDIPKFRVFQRDMASQFLPTRTSPTPMPESQPLISGGESLRLPAPSPKQSRPQVTAVSASPVPQPEHDDITRKLVAWISTHALLDIVAPWLECPDGWSARHIEKEGIVFQLPPSLYKATSEASTQSMLREAALGCTGSPKVIFELHADRALSPIPAATLGGG